MKQIELTDDVAKVVEHILAQEPVVVRDENHSMSFVLDADEYGNTMVASFNRFVNSYLVKTSYEQTANIAIGEVDTLDALCAAWIRYRVAYLPPSAVASTDDELGDLNEAPF